MDIQQTAWFMKYQPQTINDLIFDNNEHKTLVLKWIDDEKIDGNVVFYGKPGLGKTATSELLVRTIIKVQNDLFKTSDRGVELVDEKIRPFLSSKPVRSKQKIVYLEEIDKLSSMAQTSLKEGVLEKYQHIASFICCTNYIKKVDSALLTRFTYKIPFSGTNIDGIFSRLEYILTNENATFSADKLKEYVTKFYKLGIRELINNLQLQYISNNGNINFDNISTLDSLEDQVVNLILSILGKMNKLMSKDKRMCIITPLNSAISEEYNNLIKLIYNNFNLNYNYIYDRLVDYTINFIPFHMIISKYGESLENKKYPYSHLLGCLYELMQCVSDMNG